MFNNSINNFSFGSKSVLVNKLFDKQTIILPSGLNIKFEKDYNDKYEIGKYTLLERYENNAFRIFNH